MKQEMGLPVFWRIVGATCILFLVVGVFTGRNIQQSEEAVSRLLAERGITTMRIFESSLRGNIRMQERFQVEDIMEDLSRREEIQFMVLTTSDGTVIAHSDPGKRDKALTFGVRSPRDPDFSRKLENMLPYKDEENSLWGMVYVEGKSTFLVHRMLFDNRALFPVQYVVENEYGDLPFLDMDLMFSPLTNDIHLFVGLDPSPLQKMKEQYRKTALFSGLWVLFAGLMAFFALFMIQRESETKKRVASAEKLAANMVEEVRRLETDMRKREKLAAVGDLAAGVAHELRNPLSSIKGYATYFGGRFPEGSEDRKAAHVMVQEVERLNRVISDLIGVSRPTDIHPVKISLESLVESTIRLIHQDARQHGVILELTGKDVEFHVDPDRFRQALLNVCLNAVEAMPEGGVLRIHIEESREPSLERGDAKGRHMVVQDSFVAGETFACGKAFLSGESFVVIDVIDNGPGIAPEILSRIFDPYFTTKSRGTGLGLINVAKIVEAHGGTVQASSALGKGTTFRFIMPKNPDMKRLVEMECPPAEPELSGGLEQEFAATFEKQFGGRLTEKEIEELASKFSKGWKKDRKG